MKINIVYKNKELIEKEESIARIESIIEKKTNHLGKLVQSFPDDTVHMQLTIERNFHRQEYYVSLNLFLPPETLHVSENDNNVFHSINLSMEHLEKQIKKLKSKLRREDSFIPHEKLNFFDDE